jgi:hypothetical protein
MELMLTLAGLFSMLVVSLSLQYSCHKNKRISIAVRK